mmetsp:Transcript_48611/g.150557  ORF Transcript_48611/g.150557 Transcript_48611/m.150557 type:complete len:211 (-) Transcript_48611:159-791(-)
MLRHEKVPPVAAQGDHLFEQPPQTFAWAALVVLELLLQDLLREPDLAEHRGGIAPATVVLVWMQVASKELVARGQHRLEDVDPKLARLRKPESLQSGGLHLASPYSVLPPVKPGDDQRDDDRHERACESAGRSAQAATQHVHAKQVPTHAEGASKAARENDAGSLALCEVEVLAPEAACHAWLDILVVAEDRPCKGAQEDSCLRSGYALS